MKTIFPRTASVRTSTGCPHRCNFCVVHFLANGKYLQRAPEEVVDEIAHIEEEHIYFVDDEMFPIPKSIVKGKIIKTRDENGVSRYDFQYVDKYGYKNTLGGLSHMFNKEFWNYAKLISSVLRHGMPIPNVVNLVSSLRLDSATINTWKNGVERALRKYIPNGTKPKKGTTCPECGSENLVYQEGCLVCTSCGASRCG